ncbi:MAG: signal recognition particle-docking protein FtsY [Defluviitaleaceae bacterium]|nr:signal recognition particle-docking protein FtsY [Defluviitaleaceae bacterium]
MSIFNKFIDGLQKTRKSLIDNVEGVLSVFTVIDEDLFDQLEEALIMADIGVETAVSIMDSVRSRVKRERISEVSALKDLVADEISNMIKPDEEFILKTPAVILVIGVNGVGKTTAIGKLANKYKSEGKSVILAAADTFRAAAIDQLEIWATRNNVPIVKHQENSDPAAVIFDAVQAAKKRNIDVLICDTAGRLHNKQNLMEELRKIDKIITKEYDTANKEVFLVLDATTGQNALQQAKIFRETAQITGIILTKLDGTAKGGIVIAIKNELDIPVRYIGIGEKITDIEPFDAEAFSKALFSGES